MAILDDVCDPVTQMTKPCEGSGWNILGERERERRGWGGGTDRQTYRQTKTDIHTQAERQQERLSERQRDR